MTRVVASALVVAFALAGCGSSDPSSTAAIAGDLPADTRGYLELDTSLDSEQWERVEALLARFPDSPSVVEELNEELRREDLEYERDVEPALGDRLVVASVGNNRDDVVVLTQPEDEEKWRALVRKLADGDDVVFGEVEGWRAAAQSTSAIDSLKNGSGALADDDAFEAARGELGDDVLAFAFARGSALDETNAKLDWIAGALAAEERGGALTVVARGADAAPTRRYASTRVGEAPADALAFASFDAGELGSRASQFGTLGSLLGIRVDDLAADLQGEGAAWFRLRGFAPELTVVAGTTDPARARAALDDALGGLDARVGVVGRDVVATTGASPAEALERSGAALGNSAKFRAAVDAAGMPARTSGFFYVDVARASGLLALAGDDAPDEAGHLRHFRAVVGWAEPDGTGMRFRLFAETE